MLIKKCIVKVFHKLQDLKVIEPEVEILTKQNRLKEVTRLTSILVSRSEFIFYRENVNNKFNYLLILVCQRYEIGPFLDFQPSKNLRNSGL